MKAISEEQTVINTVYKYLSEDGFTFNTKKQCEEHERSIAFDLVNAQIKHIDIINQDDVYSKAYYIRTEDQHNLLIKAYSAYCDFDLEGWYIVCRYDGGDYDDYYEITSLNRLKSDWERFIKQFNEE